MLTSARVQATHSVVVFVIEPVVVVVTIARSKHKSYDDASSVEPSAARKYKLSSSAHVPFELSAKLGTALEFELLLVDAVPVFCAS